LSFPQQENQARQEEACIESITELIEEPVEGKKER
jgi:hypothetical protein